MPTYHIVLDLEMNPVSEVCCYTSNGLKTETIEIGAIKIDANTNFTKFSAMDETILPITLNDIFWIPSSILRFFLLWK